MNQFNAANMPINTCTSFGLFGDLRHFIALLWSRFTSIPQWVIMYPRNLLAPTPKAHLSALRRNLCRLSSSNISMRSPICPQLHFAFYYHIINVYLYLYHMLNLLPKHFCHYPLISSPCILQAEQHHGVVIISIGRDKCRFFPVLSSQGNLMVILKSI